MPHLLDEAFAAVGASSPVELVPLHPAYRAEFADGSAIAVHTGAAEMEAEVRAVCGPAAAAGYRKVRAWLTALYRAEIDTFIRSNLDSPLDLLVPDLARLAALGGFRRLGPQVARMLPDERLQRIFTFQALYAGVPPARALGAYGVIAYMDTVAGVYFPRGGMRAVATALADAAAGAGVTFRYGRAATGLERRGRRVTAVRHRAAAATAATAATDTAATDGAGEDWAGGDTDRLACDAVVLTPELTTAYRLLGHTPRRPVPLRWAPSAVVLHAGLASTRPDRPHHTISFGAAWERTFREIVDEGRLMSDPSLLVTRPTATDPGLAPPGCDLSYVLAPCPHLGAHRSDRPFDWERAGPAYRDELLGVLERRGLGWAGGDVLVQRLVTPADWAAAGLAQGTPFSLAHTLAQTGPFRPRNRVRGLRNVVLAGCGTTPGVGIPPVLISGRLAAARIRELRP